MSEALERWNLLTPADAEKEILACCGSRAWARAMASRRPIANEAAMLSASDEIWRRLSEADWMEAFRSHPRIGESRAERPAGGHSAVWSAKEQSGVAGGEDAVKVALTAGNREYEKRFGHLFIVCATGKNAPEILSILRRRLRNDALTELHEAAEQQRQITQIRLKRWLGG